jgi:predicted O-methyltransferase YrrM
MDHRVPAASIADSDKHYWHRFIETYRAAFARLGEVRRVIEFGVLHGASIGWLAECFPGAEIVGADILPAQPGWPCEHRISYRQIDQADREAVRRMLDAVEGDVDLVIDDGSHVPQHQATCLAEGMARLRPTGLYILEDIATSHPLHAGFAGHSMRDGGRIPNVLNALLAIQHIKDAGLNLNSVIGTRLSAPEMLSEPDVATLFATTGRVEIHKRTQLPLRCYACSGNQFDYVSWLCRCGAELYHPADSMTALIWKR